MASDVRDAERQYRGEHRHEIGPVHVVIATPQPLISRSSLYIQAKANQSIASLRTLMSLVSFHLRVFRAQLTTSFLSLSSILMFLTVNSRSAPSDIIIKVNEVLPQSTDGRDHKIGRFPLDVLAADTDLSSPGPLPTVGVHHQGGLAVP